MAYTVFTRCDRRSDRTTDRGNRSHCVNIHAIGHATDRHDDLVHVYTVRSHRLVVRPIAWCIHAISHTMGMIRCTLSLVSHVSQTCQWYGAFCSIFSFFLRCWLLQTLHMFPNPPHLQHNLHVTTNMYTNNCSHIVGYVHCAVIGTWRELFCPGRIELIMLQLHCLLLNEVSHETSYVLLNSCVLDS